VSDAESRYIRIGDHRLSEVVVPLPASWWSRPYEYAWASEFVEREHTVLDAACGISHPFKIFLARACASLDVCDLDERILNISEILADMVQDGMPFDAFIELDKMTRSKANIANLPYDNERFDRVFCISTIEHMPQADVPKALAEFCRVIKKDGLIILTLDVPPYKPARLKELVESAGLTFAGSFEPEEPTNILRTSMYGGLTVFRAVLKRV
jgi:ubiquinone/menaquinone biosynthesis C-methylase UbiE